MAKRPATANVQLKLRCKEPLRAQLEKSAARRGVSMNEEMVDRLEESFRRDDRFGGPRLIELVETTARVMRSTGETAGWIETGTQDNQGRWLAVPYAYQQAEKAARTVLKYHRPPGEIIEPDWSKAKVVGGDPKETIEKIQRAWPALGELIAAKDLHEKEERK